jgi:hypothetical protein
MHLFTLLPRITGSQHQSIWTGACVEGVVIRKSLVMPIRPSNWTEHKGMSLNISAVRVPEAQAYTAKKIIQPSCQSILNAGLRVNGLPEHEFFLSSFFIQLTWSSLGINESWWSTSEASQSQPHLRVWVFSSFYEFYFRIAFVGFISNNVLPSPSCNSATVLKDYWESCFNSKSVLGFWWSFP